MKRTVLFVVINWWLKRNTTTTKLSGIIQSDFCFSYWRTKQQRKILYVKSTQQPVRRRKIEGCMFCTQTKENPTKSALDTHRHHWATSQPMWPRAGSEEAGAEGVLWQSLGFKSIRQTYTLKVIFNVHRHPYKKHHNLVGLQDMRKMPFDMTIKLAVRILTFP